MYDKSGLDMYSNIITHFNIIYIRNHLLSEGQTSREYKKKNTEKYKRENSTILRDKT